jgi:hypothetical protein
VIIATLMSALRQAANASATPGLGGSSKPIKASRASAVSALLSGSRMPMTLSHCQHPPTARGKIVNDIVRNRTETPAEHGFRCVCARGEGPTRSSGPLPSIRADVKMVPAPEGLRPLQPTQSGMQSQSVATLLAAAA